MKKLLLLFILITTLVFGSATSEQLRVNILKNIIVGVENISTKKVWSDNEELLHQFQNTPGITTTQNYEDANFLILEHPSNFNIKNKYVFVLDYDLLYDIPQSFGAFFWKKGRPNIVFIQPRLEEYHIKLAKPLEPYIEEQLW